MSDLKQAIDSAGGAKAIAELLGVTRGAIYDFIRRGYVPAEHCPTIEKFCKGVVRCEDLNDRVDWSYLRDSDRRNADRRKHRA